MGKNTPLDVDSRIDADWESVPHPVLVVDRNGLVRTLSASARTMLARLPRAVRSTTSSRRGWRIRPHGWRIRHRCPVAKWRGG